MLRFEKDRKGCGVYVDYGFYVDGVVLVTTKGLFANCRLFARYSVPRMYLGMDANRHTLKWQWR